MIANILMPLKACTLDFELDIRIPSGQKILLDFKNRFGNEKVGIELKANDILQIKQAIEEWEHQRFVDYHSKN